MAKKPKLNVQNMESAIEGVRSDTISIDAIAQGTNDDMVLSPDGAAEEVGEGIASVLGVSADGSSQKTRVGRWMSREEYDKMIETGFVQMSADNKVHVANPAAIDAFSKQAPPGSVYVEFDVPSNTISKGGKDGWGIVNGPGSLQDRLNAKKGLPKIEKMPKATNIEIKGEK